MSCRDDRPLVLLIASLAGAIIFACSAQADTVRLDAGTAVSVVAITAGVGAPTALTEAQGGSLLTNTGTTVKAAATLPDGATVGTYFDVLCDDADGFRLVADTGATITMEAAGACASAGYWETVLQDSGFRVTLTAANVWRATRIGGTWRKDSTTSAGWAFTPTAWAAWSGTANHTNQTSAWSYCQVGDMVEVSGLTTYSGAPAAATLAVTLPSGLPIDETFYGTSPDSQDFGTWHLVDATGPAAKQPGSALYLPSTNEIRAVYATPGNNVTFVTASAPITLASGDYIRWSFRYRTVQ